MCSNVAVPRRFGTIQSLKSLPASSWMMTTLIKSMLSETSFGALLVQWIKAGRGLLDHTVAPTLPKRLQGLPGTLLCIHEPRLCGLYPDRWLWAKGGAAEAGSTIIRLLTRCGMGSDTTVGLYLIVPRKAGGIYVIAMYATGGEDAAETVDSGIRAAVFRALPK
jgi:hypothetical protein